MKSVSSAPRVLLSAGMIQGGLSGVGRYVVELANRLARKAEISLSVCGLASDRDLFPEIADDDWVAIPEGYADGAKNLLWHQRSLPGILRNGYDLLHTPSYRRIVARSPVPQVATIHDCAPFRLRDKYGFLRGIFGRHVAPWLARRCEHVISVSETTKHDLVDFYRLPADGIEVIYNGLDHARYRPGDQAEIESFISGKGLDAPFFLYLSRLEHPGKNHIRLIEGFEAYREKASERMLLVLGGADWHGAEAIRDRIAASPLRDDIILPGFVDEKELPLWYQSAKALVFPSLIEGFGLPVAEAMACGTPVACSDRGSLPEVGGDAALYFDPESPAEIANCMKQLTEESAELADRRIQAGIEQSSKFDWDEASERTCQIYLGALGERQ